MNENTNPGVQVIENASLDDVRPGDHLTWERTDERGGLIYLERREGIAHFRDEGGDWRTKDGQWITHGEGKDITITIRRPVADGE